MTEINIAKKGLKQQLWSWKTTRVTNARKSAAFRSIMTNKVVAHVINKAGEKRAFFNALKNRAMQSKKINRKLIREVLGDVEHSGQFSHHEMMLLRKNLGGESMSSNITREHAPMHADNYSSEKTGASVSHIGSEKEFGKIAAPSARIEKIESDLKAKREEDRTGNKNVSNQKESNVLNFGVSQKNVRNAEGILAPSSRERIAQNDSQAFGQVAGHLYGFANKKQVDIDKVKSMLAKIQGEADTYDEEGAHMKKAA